MSGASSCNNQAAHDATASATSNATIALPTFPDQQSTSTIKPVIWLINDDNHWRHNTLQKLYPCRIEALKFEKYLTQHHLATLQRDIDSDKPFLLWIVIPSGDTGLDMRSSRRLKQYAELIGHQLNRNSWTFTEFPFQAYSELTNALPESINKSKIRWCNLGIRRPDNQMVLNTRTSTVHNMELPDSIYKCHCTSKDDHAKVNNKYNPKEDLNIRHILNHTATSMITSLVMLIAANTNIPCRPPDLTAKQTEINMRKYMESTFRDNPLAHLTETQQRRLLLTPDMTTEPTPAYPTESRIRQKEKEKAAKEAGTPLVKRKRPVTVLPGDDDLGEDVTQLNFVDLLLEAYYDFGLDETMAPEYTDRITTLDNFLYNLEYDATPHYWLFGADYTDHNIVPPQCHTYTDFDAFMATCGTMKDDSHHVDVVEICGGAARPSKVLIRRWHHIKVGLNFDAIVGFELTEPKDVAGLWRYLRYTQPLVVILATPCTGLAGFKGINAARGSETHFQNRRLSIELGTLGGEIVLWQLQNRRHFLSENPLGSDLFKLDIYQYILMTYPHILRQTIDMCAAGMVDYDSGRPIRKATEIWTSSSRIVKPLEKFRCNGQHEHEPIQGVCSDGELRSHKCRIWPWPLATAVAAGIVDEVRHTQQQQQRNHRLTYPESATQADGKAPEFPPYDERKRSNRHHWPCPACNKNLHKNDPTHTRHDYDCRFPLEESIEWKCPSCKAGHSRYAGHHTNTPGECRWTAIPERQGTPRIGSHPRQPRTPATSDPTIDMHPGNAPQDDIDDDTPHPSAAGSNGPPTLDYEQPRPLRSSTTPQSHAPPQRSADAGTQASDIAWTRFDLGRSLQLLRSLTPGVVLRTLRMLHLRWWHVPAARFRRILQTAGAPESATKLCDNIVDTCRVCRVWKRPPPISATTRIVERFNERVQTDLMFVSATDIIIRPQIGHNRQHTKDDPKADPWQHNICTCTRLTAAYILENKTVQSLIHAFEITWVRPYGNPQYLESDQEGAWNSDEGRVYLSRLGIELDLKGVDAHAKMLEKHNHLLRLTFLKLRSQAIQEGIQATKQHLLTCAVTAKNCLFTIGDTTPMIAVFGRQSAVLPNTERTASTLDDSHTGPDGPSRGRHRLQEIATQSMVEASAITRMQTAANTKTRETAEAKNISVGDEVEFFRNPGQKDAQGWRGPAEVLKIGTDGTFDIKWQGHPLTCRPQDIRAALIHFIMCYTFFTDDTITNTTPLKYLIQYLEQLAQGTIELHAVTHNGTGNVLTQKARAHHHVFQAILHIATCHLHLDGCVGARLSHGIVKLRPLPNISNTLIWFWPQYRSRSGCYLQTPNDSTIDTRTLHHKHNVDNLCAVQFLMRPIDEIPDLQRQFSTIPNLGTQHPLQQPDHHPMAEPTIPTTLQPMDTQVEKRDRSFSSNTIASQEPPHKSQCLPPEDDPDTETHPHAASSGEAQNTPIPDSEDEDMLLTTTQPMQIHLADLHHTPTTQEAYLTSQGIILAEPICDGDLEMFIYAPLAHWDIKCPHELAEDEVMVFIINKHRISVVIRRDLDNLTPDEIKQNWDQVEAAMYDELLRWFELKTFQRKLAKDSGNIIDGTWVIKWKRVKTTNPDGTETTSRIVKARLTARGFKDLQAYQNEIATFSGTSTKAAQRMVNAHAAQNKYVLYSMDISASFLKGMTFTEIAKLTGDPLRSVQFRLPNNCVHILRRLPGLKDFDPVAEVLDFLKPMWGLKDAPRAFGLRRDKALRDYGARPTNRDKHFWVKTSPPPKPISVNAMSTHIDDIKGSSTDEERTKLAVVLKRYFGNDLKESLQTFEFTGVKHKQSTDYSVECHQDHYVLELSIIPLDANSTTPDDNDADEAETEAFNSLLGGLGWLLVTRADISPYVGFLQRLGRKPKRKHLKMINKVLRYCKRRSATICYRRLPNKPYLLVVADSAYQSKDDDSDCIALRGFFIFLACSIDGKPFPNSHVQLIDFVSKKLHTISRSAFAAELRNIFEAMQEVIGIAVQFHDVYRGPLTPQDCVQVQDSASYFLDVHVVTDNYGLYAAITKEEPSPGSDVSMANHVRAARTYLDNRNITTITWCDNRDMIADGLTKGRPARDAINDVLSTGQWILETTTCETWASKHAPGSHKDA